MTLREIEEGAAVFIDSNVFIYHFVRASPQCSQLLSRCASGELRGLTSALVVAEVCHRLMIIEAVEKALVAPGNIVRKLAGRPDIVRQLALYQGSIEAIPLMKIEVMPVADSTLARGMILQSRYGLLTNDSLIVASAILAEAPVVATADRGLTVVREIDFAVPDDLDDAV